MQTLQNQSYDKPLRMLPECKFRPGIGHCGQRAWYTATVPLPLSVGVILARAEGRWYRSMQQMLDDADLLVLNVTRFYLDKNPINIDANQMSEFLRSAILDRAGDSAAREPAHPAPAVGRRQLLSTVGEARSGLGHSGGPRGDAEAGGSHVPVRVGDPQAGAADSHDLPGSGGRERRHRRAHTQPIEAEVQISDRSQRRQTRLASEAYDSGGDEITDWGRRTTRARSNGAAAAEVPQRRPLTRKRTRAADSDSEADWEAEDVMSDESLLDEQENARRSKGRSSKRSRR